MTRSTSAGGGNEWAVLRFLKEKEKLTMNDSELNALLQELSALRDRVKKIEKKIS